jgi:hypothetical protein
LGCRLARLAQAQGIIGYGCLEIIAKYAVKFALLPATP